MASAGTDPSSFTHFDVGDGLVSPNSVVWQSNLAEGASLAAADGSLWFASGSTADAHPGLVRYNGRSFEQILPEITNSVSALVQARDETIWIGTGRQGLARYANGRAEWLTSSNGLVSDEIASLALGSNGDLWIGSLWKGLSRYDGRQFQNFDKELGSGKRWLAWSLAVDRNDKLWVGMAEEFGLLIYEGQRFEPLTTTKDMAGQIQNLLLTSDGALWIGTSRGLNRVRDGNLTTYRKGKDRLLDNCITGLTEDADGVLWIGTTSGSPATMETFGPP